MVDCDEDKGNPSTVDKSHQLTLTFPQLILCKVATNLQQPIVHPPVFAENGHCPVVEFTMGWLLGTIHHWDGREHTLSSGFGHYPLTYKVLSVFVLLDRTLTEGI